MVASHFEQMRKRRFSEDRMLGKGDRMGPLRPAVSGQAQKGVPSLENCPPSRVGVLPNRVSASQCSSYVKEGSKNNK